MENAVATNEAVKVLEGRWLAFITTIALFFGGWWIQNQYDAILKTQQQLNEYTRYVDDKYVQKEYMTSVDRRLDRIENKIDELRNDKSATARGH